MIDSTDEPYHLRRERRRQPQSTPMDRLPPHSTEGEQGALGCVLSDSGKDSINLLVKLVGNKAEMFYDLRHQEIYKVLLKLYENNGGIDLITVAEKLKSCQQLDAVGGHAYLSSLMDVIPSAANIEYYLDIIKEKYALRKMVTTCTDVVSKVYESDVTPKELLSECEAAIHAIGSEIYSRERRSIKEVVTSTLDRVQGYIENQGRKLPGLSTGFSNLDNMLLGLHRKEVTVIGARPSVGKTSLAANIVEHVALVEKKPVAFYSFEMDAESLVLRMMASRARLNLRKIRGGYLTEDCLKKITVATGHIAKAPIFIEDRPGMELLEWQSSIRWLRSVYGIELAVIDYLQLMSSASKRAQQNRRVEIGEISRGIKKVAMELEIPIIVLSQLNREIEREKKPRKPKLADLRESGDIEQDADNVLLPYRVSDLEKTEDDDDLPPNHDNAEPYDVGVVIPKQRNGPTGIEFLRFIPQQTRFEVPEPEPPINQADIESIQQWSRTKDP